MPQTDVVKIALITMPVVAVNCPSISLTQVVSATRRALGDRVSVDILYLNHDFARFLSSDHSASALDLYQIFCGNQLHNTGVADWFFRQAAFPELPDNSDEYFARYYPQHAADTQRFRDAILEKREGLPAFMDSLIDRYRLHEFAIVGFTSMFQQNVATFAMARRLKECNSDITIVMGGANCEPPMGREIVKNVEQIDYVFSGPALISFPEFVGQHLAGNTAGCNATKGVLSRANLDPVTSAEIGEELPIDEVLELDYDGFFDSLEQHIPGGDHNPVVFFETSRGCWWGERSHCTFCGLNGMTMKYRSMEPPHAIHLINTLFDRYGSKSTFFFSVDNILPKSYVKEVLPFLNTPPDSTVFYEVKADLTEHDVRALAASGVKKIQPGIESLASSTLKLMRKGTSAFVNLRLLKNCLKYGVTPQWNLLVGFPGEGEEVYQKYVRDMTRLVHLSPPDGAFPVRFDRYSPYYTEADDFGLDLRPYDYYDYIYPFGDDAVQGMSYYFMDRNFKAPYMKTMIRWLSPVREKIEVWRSQWEGTTPRAKLYLERNGTSGVVHDTRHGQAIEHHLDAAQVSLLDHLEKVRLERHLADLVREDGIDLDAELAFLDERELLWRENDRLMSIVLPEKY